MGAGGGLTVMVPVAVQPAPKLKVTNEVPADTPVTTPDDVPTVATAALPLAQVPPKRPVNESVAPTHTLAGPDIAGGRESMVTVWVAAQPVPNV